MIEQEALSKYLSNLLMVNEYKDYCPNGLQVEGKPEIHRIMTGVSASLKLIKEAIVWKADALIVHHGYFWKGESPLIVGSKYQRIANLIKHDINLYGFHLPLDCHPCIGNNARIGALLQLVELSSHTVDGVDHLLWTGSLQKPMNAAELTTLLRQTFAQDPIHLSADNNGLISKLSWCSGAAHRYLAEAKRLGADAFITGEVSEQTLHAANEEGVHCFACGHHATERYGVKALGEQLEKEFGITHKFCDIPNPI